MNTTPPTETPAALLTPDELAWVQVRHENTRAVYFTVRFENDVGKIGASLDDIPRLLTTIADLRARNEALTAEREGAYQDGYREGYEAGCAKDVADAEARAESLERRNHDLAQDLEKAESELARLREAVKPVPSPIGHRARRAGEEGEG